MPLESTTVDARVDGYLATVNVKQRFHNPYDTKIEATYLFPLPHDAAVTEFVMTIGERRIRGILREREEAEALYAAARAAGHNASLMTQERPNVFTQKVANIEPGRAIDIDLTYFQALAYRDGDYRFSFPMVVGPRFNPAGTSGRPVAVKNLKPNQRSGHAVDLTLTLAPGVAIEAHRSHNHRVDVVRETEDGMTVRIADRDTVPNKDFVFSYRVAGGAVRSNLLTYRDPQTGEGFFTLTLLPPADLKSLARQPMEMVFVLDGSGSMRGQPMKQAKAAVRAALDRLEADDTFQIVRFSSDASQLGDEPLAANPRNLRAARRYLDGLSGSGGTQMIAGVKAALDFPHDERRYRMVTFLTDGFIGNENDIFAAVKKRLGAARVFSFGVGSSTNQHLLFGMARLGRGAAAILGLNDDAVAVMDRFFDRISHPALTDLELDFGSARVSGVYPRRLPDLWVGRPVVVTGKFTGEMDAVRWSGHAGDGRITSAVTGAATDGPPALAKVWARQRMADLADRLALGGGEIIAQEIRQTALRYGLMSEFTAFVAVDATRVTEGDHGVSLRVPVPVPDGVRYETAGTP